MDANERAVAIEVRDVRKRWGDFEALKGVSFKVYEREMVALLGPSGSGKSTLMRCINHLETINEGRIYVCGELVGYEERNGLLYELGDRAVSEQRTKVGMAFQSFNLFRHLTAIENVTLALRCVRGLDRAGADAVARTQLAWVGMEDKADAYPAQLSGGQQQRVAIARAMAMQPEVLLLDEPTSALDPELSREVVATIRRLSLEGQTMVIATHDLSLVRDYADRVLFMVAGQIVEDAPAEKFFNNPENERTVQFLRSMAGE
ncbi:amino acid ABC transporter ATP-binding protein [Synergistaceae bacterium OttesenSCG-928-I11]|nr:amino acid ABC transporter ATP-binding protein [Synergistaceae bacterium OttesenSCG-928-I11]